MLGKDLEDLSLKELQILEDQMSEGILAVKDKKVLNRYLHLCTNTHTHTHTYLFHLCCMDVQNETVTVSYMVDTNVYVLLC